MIVKPIAKTDISYFQQIPILSSIISSKLSNIASVGRRQAARFGIRTGTISGNSLTRPERGGLILGYTAIDEKQIKKGVRQLSEAMKSLQKNESLIFHFRPSVFNLKRVFFGKTA